MEAEIIPMIEGFIKTGTSRSAIDSMKSKYGAAFGEWKSPQTEIGGAKPKRYERGEEYAGTMFIAINYNLYFDPADVYVMNDSEYEPMLAGPFAEQIRKEMATIPVEINIDSLKSQYDAFCKK